MGAAASARRRFQRASVKPVEYDRLTVAAREKADEYDAAGLIEDRVGGRLAALEVLGWRVLSDRRRHGSRRVHVDFVLVGPGGVLVVDVSDHDDEHEHDAGRLIAMTQAIQDTVARVGLIPQLVRPLLVLAGHRPHEWTHAVEVIGELGVAAWLTLLGRRLEPDRVAVIHDLLDREFPSYDDPAHRPARPRLVVVGRHEPSPGVDLDELTDSILQAARQGPLEDWMTFLHPDQLRLVSTSWNGPARISGSAGTGKTVVGLHRAAHLAERLREPVLFVTYVRTLPVVLSNLAHRLAPAVADRIEFTNLHALALRLLADAGIAVQLDPARVDAAFDAAWAAHGRDSILPGLDPRASYWREELDHVLKGRGLTDYDDYAHLSRVGRRIPLRSEHRKAMWEVYAAYERRLRIADLVDVNDVLMMARDLIRAGDSPLAASYAAVIVDEVQDLDLIGLQLLHAIAGDGPDRLLLVGDGRQAVYPGGFTLSEAGISVAGRATVLHDNYRNTAEILEIARRVVAEDPFEDPFGDERTDAVEPRLPRRGLPPVVVRATDPVSLDLALVEQLHETAGDGRIPWGDVAVLVHKRGDVDHYGRVLRRAGIEFVELTDYDGVGVDKVKLGTFRRAKGLEFRQVLIPGLKTGFQPQRDESQEAFLERAERTRREIHVGMTRARDGLWLGYVGA